MGTTPEPPRTRLGAYADRWMEASWLAALVTAPLLFHTASARTFEADKVAAVRAVAACMGAAWLVSAYERGTRARAVWSAWRVPLVRPVIGFVLVLLVSTAASIDPGKSLWGSYFRLGGAYTTLAYAVLFGAVAARLSTRAQVARLCATVVVTSVPVGLYAVVQRLGEDPLVWQDYVAGRVSSTLGSATFVGEWMTIVLPVTVACGLGAWRTAGTWHALIFFSAAVLQLVTIVLSESRGPLLGTLAAGFVMGLLALRGRPRTRLVWIGAGALAVLFTGALNVRGTAADPLLDPVRRTSLGARVASMSATESGTVRLRLLVWRAALGLVRPRAPIGLAGDPVAAPDALHGLRPLVGYGPETFYDVFASVHPAQLAHFEQRESSADRAHNESIDHWVQRGLLGLGAYLVLLACVLRAALRGARGGWSILHAGLAAALVGHFVQTQFSFSIAATHVYFWVYAGLIVALTGIDAEGRGEGAGVRSVVWIAGLAGAVLAFGFAVPWRFPFTILLFVFAGFGCAFACGRRAASGMVALRPGWPWVHALALVGAVGLVRRASLDVVRADVDLARGNQHAVRGEWDRALALYARAQERDPRESRHCLALAQGHMHAARAPGVPEERRAQLWRRGAAYAARARELAPYNPYHANNLGEYHLAWGRSGDAEQLALALEWFERASQLAPNNVLIHNRVAQLLRLRGDATEAIERLLLSVELDPSYPATWVTLGDTYAVVGESEQALDAHVRAMTTEVRGSDGFAAFADKRLDVRLGYHLAQGRLDELMAALEAAVDRDPRDASRPFAIGRALWLAERSAAALPHLTRARELVRARIAELRGLRSLAGSVDRLVRDAVDLEARIAGAAAEVRSDDPGDE